MGEAGDRSRRHGADALDFDAAYRMNANRISASDIAFKINRGYEIQLNDGSRQMALNVILRRLRSKDFNLSVVRPNLCVGLICLFDKDN